MKININRSENYFNNTHRGAGTLKAATNRVIVVEGKYDRARLSEILDATIIETNGFGIFKDTELAKTLSRLAKERGLIILTDSDTAGLLIRNRIINIVGAENVKNVYIPDIKGKERRKKKPSKEGFLGVEGISAAELQKILDSADVLSAGEPHKYLTKTDMYFYGLSGGTNSENLRKELKKMLGLPTKMSADKLLEMLNILTTKEELEKMIEEITGGVLNV
ncbi:MAG: DUF4093 domain-containing protein [Clostridiales bacterium]|nr:MAG: DUF4093 domain-containing protein [Clostridiales bacterium]